MGFGSNKQKNRLSFFGGRGGGDPPSNERFDPSPTGHNNADSAYASSEGPSNAGDSMRPDLVSLENHGQIGGISADRNIAMNRAGNVVDEDTGEEVIVTTTTTTTTTTTKTGGKKGTHVEVSTHPNGQPATGAIVEAPGDSPRSGHHNGYNQQTTPTSYAETAGERPIMQSTMNRLRPDATAEHPTVPSRNPNRKSGDYDSSRFGAPQIPPQPNISNHNVSNFSYPSRPDLRAQAASDESASAPAPKSEIKSTFDNLKAAAVGLHGVGETLRGTLNNEVDQRLHLSRNPEKQAAINAHNQEVLSAGNREMAGVRSNIRPKNAPPPGPGNRDGMSNGPGTGYAPHSAPGGGRDMLGPGSRPGYAPNSAAPDGDPRNSSYRRPTPEPEPPISPIQSNEPVDDMRRGFRKLLKRKPAA